MAIKKFKVNASKQAKSIKSTKKSVKASSSLKVKPYVINKGQSGEYYGLKNAEDNQVLHSAPNNWKSERGAINWAKKKGYDVVDSACGKKSVKASYDDAEIITDEFLTKVNNPYLEDQYQKNDFEVYLIDGDTLEFRYCKTRKAKDLATRLAKKFYPEYDVLDLTKLGASKNTCAKKTVKASSSVSAKRQFSVTATIAGDLTNKDKRSIKTIIDKFFTNDGKSYKSGNWRISAGGYDLVAELYEQDIPVCGILYFAGVYTVESYGYDADDTSKYVADILSDVVSVGVISNEVELKLSTVESSMSAKKQFGVKASKSAKKRKAIKASGIQNDIVMYFNGDNVYQGSVYDLADAVENLCYDDEVNAKFQEWCNQFGDPFDFDGSPIDTARVFTDIIIHEAEESPVSEDGQSEFYEDGDGILDFEIFYADEFSIDGAKSIKCWDNGNDVWEYQESYDNYYDEEPPEHIGKELERLAKLTDKYMNMWFDKFEELHPNERYSNVYDFPDVDEAVGFTRDAAEYYPDQIEISASKSIKCDKSLNLNAKPNYTDWVLRGYKFDGEDVTTLRIDFQDDVKKAVMDMFSDPDIETVDLYKIPTEQETTGVFEDEEYFSTITRDDINASTDITAALNKKSDINDEQYNQALADEVADMLRADGFEDIEVSVAPEAISFFIDDEVMFVQPTNMITPNMADIYDDCTELFNAVKEATTDKMWKLYDEENKAMRDAWEDPDISDPDYATRAVTLSRKAKGKDISAAEETIDIDDLDYISGDDEQEDWGYGFDSNGEPVTESMVEELERIAQEILDKSEIHNIDKYADLHNFNYYASIPYIQESFDISFTYVADIYELSKNGMATDEGIYTTVAPYNIHFNVRCENGEVEYAECTDVDVNDGYVKDVELTNFNLDALVQFATDLVNPVAMDIYNATTNI